MTGELPMIDQQANSGLPLEGLAPASAAQADVAPPIAAPTSDAAADAAAWARIDRALQSTRKWLWVFVASGCLASAFLASAVIGLSLVWRSTNETLYTFPGVPLEIVCLLLLLSDLSIWAIASAAGSFGILRWIKAIRRLDQLNNYAALVKAIEPQPFAWSAGAISTGCAVAYLTLLLVLVVYEAALR